MKVFRYIIPATVGVTAIGLSIGLGVIGGQNEQKEREIQVKEDQVRTRWYGANPPEVTIVRPYGPPINPPGYSN